LVEQPDTIPEEDRHLLRPWSQAIVKMYELTTTDDQRAAATVAAQEFMDYIAALIAAKRAHPDGLLVSELAGRASVEASARLVTRM